MNEARRRDLVQALPYGRRFARALTGSQKEGDILVMRGVNDLLASSGDIVSVRDSLYRTVTQHFSGRTSEAGQSAPSEAGALTLKQRALLLLSCLEEIPLPAVAAILDISEEDALAELDRAHSALRSAAATRVLIIEDEPIIAMDIQDVVEQCGHTVAGVAHTEADGVRLAREVQPGLILADINLGSGGDGMQAVGRIMKTHDIPVVFVTAYPERLLTGEAEEPSFVITKPFEPLTLAITTYQAVTGGLKSF